MGKMMVDVQNVPFYPGGHDYEKQLRMSQPGANWFENADLSSFLNTPDTIEFPQNMPSSQPIETDINYYTSSPETFTSSTDSSPYNNYSSDASQTPSPFDPSLFGGSPHEMYLYIKFSIPM